MSTCARAHTRQNDPSTSQAAARRASSHLGENQRAVMMVLRVLGRPVTDEELVREYNARQRALSAPRQSDSGIRSRRSELSQAGLLEEGGKQRMTTGGLGRTWSIKKEDSSASVF